MSWPTLPLTEPVAIFALVMLIILVAPLVCTRLRIPGLIGLIVAGILVGPHGARLLMRDDTMNLLGTVGLLYILFVAGLEIDLNQFVRHRYKSLVFGSLTFLIPQVGGTWIAREWLGFGWPAAILLASMFASHTPLTYPIASRLGIAKNLALVVAIGGTLVTDTAALLVLAIIARSTSGDLDASFWVQLAISLGVFLALVGWGLPILGRWFFRNVLADGNAQFAFILASVFSFAFLASRAGLEAIIGAFLAGLALNRLIPSSSALMSRVLFVGNALLIPFFLLSVGMLVDVRVFAANLDSWKVAGVMVGVVVAAKWLAALVSMLLLGFSRDQGWLLFGISVNQAAATLAAVFVGFELGLFDQAVLNGAILMILVSCFLGAWATETYGRRLAVADEGSPPEALDRPERILVPLANPANAALLMDLALMVRSSHSHEPIYPLTVAREATDVESEVARSEKLLSSAVAHAAAAAVPASPVTRVDGNVANGMVRAVRELRASAVVVGWDGRPTSRWHVLGRTLDDFLAQTTQMVLACRIRGPLNVDSRVVLVAPPFADREPGFREAVRAVKNLASELGAALLLVAPERALDRLARGLEALRPAVPLQTHALRSWDALPAGLPLEEGGADLCILLSARHGRVSWRPNLDTLPRQLARSHEELDLIVLYPAEAVDTGEFHLPSLAVEPLPTLRSEDIRLDLGPGPWEGALRSLLATRLAERPAALEAALGALTTNAQTLSLEVSPGIVLLHAHLSELAAPHFLVGLSREGICFPRVDDPTHVVLVLIGPERDRGERHLALLSALARMVRPAGLVQDLLAARTPQEARAILLRGTHAVGTGA